MGRHLLARHADRLRGIGSERWLAGAVAALIDAACAPPQLSAPAALDRCQSRMMERLEALRLAFADRPLCLHQAAVSGEPEWHPSLQSCDESAYQTDLIG
jgi:hypothetical protein